MLRRFTAKNELDKEAVDCWVSLGEGLRRAQRWLRELYLFRQGTATAGEEGGSCSAGQASFGKALWREGLWINNISTAATEAGNNALNRHGGKGYAGFGRQAYQEALLLPGKASCRHRSTLCHTVVFPLRRAWATWAPPPIVALPSPIQAGCVRCLRVTLPLL